MEVEVEGEGLSDGVIGYGIAVHGYLDDVLVFDLDCIFEDDRGGV